VIQDLAIFTELRLVTDRRTYKQADQQTHDDSVYCASIVSHGKNWVKSMRCCKI